MSDMLMQAHHQWRTRPADEAYWTIGEMYQAALEFRFGHDYFTPNHSGLYGVKTMTGQYSRLHVDVKAGEENSKNPLLRKTIALTAGDLKIKLQPTNWAFRRLCADLNAHGSFLSTCEAVDVASILNKRIKRQEELDPERTVRLMTHRNGDYQLLAVTSKDKWGTIENHKVLRWAIEHPYFEGWVTPPARIAPRAEGNPKARPATAEDVARSTGGAGGLNVKVGDIIEPHGLYLSDQDMFMLRYNPNKYVTDGSDGGIFRGIMIGNSEVGKMRLWALMFDFLSICGNLIVWDVKRVLQVRIKHVGGGAEGRAFVELEKMIKKFEKEESHLTPDLITRAKNTRIIPEMTQLKELQEQTAQFLYGRKYMTLKLAEKAVEMAEKYGPDEKCDPFSYWGIANGITRASQDARNFDRRLVMDGAAGKLLASLN